MRRPTPALLLLLPVLLSTGCGPLRRVLVGGAGDAFAGPRAVEVFSSDNDPELVADAMPLALKTYEVLIAADPNNRSLYLAAAAGFVQYASAFVEEEADRLQDEDLAKSREQRARAARLAQRGRDYALAGLELWQPGFRKALREDPAKALTGMTKKDVPLLFWAGVGWGKVISGSPSDMALVAEVSLVGAVMGKVLELDEAYGAGDVHEFFVLFEGGRSEAMGGSAQRAREHYLKALELSGGMKASIHVALASTVAVREQDVGLFRELLQKALAVDPDAVKRWRLGNILAQRKASRLLHRMPDLFVDYEDEEEE